MIAPPPEIYEFGDFRLDLAERQLFRADRSRVALTPRVFATLRYLVEHHGRLLDKEMLMKAVWPDCIVEENNLAQNISTLRRVLGDSPSAPRYIVTVPGRGYRFVAQVRTAEMEKGRLGDSPAEATGHAPLPLPEGPSAGRGPRRAEARPSGRLLLFASAVVLVLGVATFYLWSSRPSDPVAPRSGRAAFAVADKSIAVLPFDNLSGDPANAYFAEGMRDEIMTRLSKIASLKVISRTSTQQFKIAPTNVREIARQLGVANILEGSVQRSGERVRVTVQLIRAETDTHLWADTYDRKLDDMFQVETEIAQRVAQSLEATLTDPETRALTARPTANVEAHQAYLKGRYFWNKRTNEGYRQAIEHFNRAIPNRSLLRSRLCGIG